MPSPPQRDSEHPVDIQEIAFEDVEPAEWMPPPPAAIKGRGAAENPANRFERLHYETDADCHEDRVADSSGSADPLSSRSLSPDLGAPPRTVYLRDPTRTALAHNQSPDINFSASLNPYRGCQHGCIYCLTPETRVLHADLVWRPLGNVRPGDVLAGFDEYPSAPSATRKLRPSVVEAMVWSRKPTTRLITDSAEVITTALHRWLPSGSFEWLRTEQLEPGSVLRSLPTAPPLAVDDDYRAGYVAGVTRGRNGSRMAVPQRGDRKRAPTAVALWHFAEDEHECLERLVSCLGRFGVPLVPRKVREVPAAGDSVAGQPPRAGRAVVTQLETTSPARLEVVSKLVEVERSGPSYRRGFLAGFFDTAGCLDAAGFSDASGGAAGVLRLCQTDLSVLEQANAYARSLGFAFALEHSEGRGGKLRMTGSPAEQLRFFSVVQPAIGRKLLPLFGRTPPTYRTQIEALEPGGLRDVVDIQTSTRTFYAEGLATHNCYARPTHEYLGFSAGLDFETRILVKEDAPELLRRELGAKRWTPRTIGLSGVTDPYQPIERKLKLTRRCLQVIAEFRNPVQVITKSGLVARDVDVLGEMASYQGASVAVSITTLDSDLHRIMEPRAAHPDQRLAAIRALAKAGIPVGVMIAPIIPGITEHEIPAILEAAANAGAGSAGHIVLRLPHGVKDLFSAWLERHFPDRRDKVLNRLRSIRGGKLNDPRFGSRMRGEGVFATHIHDLFELSRKRAGIPDTPTVLSTAAFRRPDDAQMKLF